MAKIINLKLSEKKGFNCYRKILPFEIKDTYIIVMVP